MLDQRRRERGGARGDGARRRQGVPRARAARHAARARVPAPRRDPPVRPSPPALVVVGGAPAAGKSTVAEALRDRLGLPLIAKDALKERLGDVLDVRGRSESKQLGVATFAVQFEVLRELLAAGVSVICEGNFGASWFAALPPAQIVQVHLTAPPEVLVTRLLERSQARHPVHYDREAATEVLERAAAGEWEPLDIGGELIVVDTEAWPDLEPVISIVARFVSA